MWCCCLVVEAEVGLVLVPGGGSWKLMLIFRLPSHGGCLKLKLIFCYPRNLTGNGGPPLRNVQKLLVTQSSWHR